MMIFIFGSNGEGILNERVVWLISKSEEKAKS